ncbi:putative powdery mildew resistance protein, RPW8 [Helianthus annuus]|uniref:Powdery mildew resistance protein, RPW8 n=1 Tax=Helianthus annuus TaxID=4232 RepID=A0A251VHB4_HELAN|nr:probable disease resistance protein At4g33300 [Helianthus annuus]KAF5817765.1 putative powdery mildew resistance protein, RPW8 [Helianthus annuus]KAJ0604184.1 putative powdery mildew resistance protein, RPW8 [Helianthus annuus]KAJ0618198.1 putative powdery mildew resistance protein, RPW8 [Helianthus annuus]KAJ0776660.1 putative powdery mildew resistance protein, RPW8 [Helianthus annuus]KAJ0939222.1 putative powdery mildew resistance protein, RPW8 [Helianthus annuus]
MADLFAGEIATELLKLLITITRKACLCKPSAQQLILTVNQLLPIITEIKYSGVELTQTRQHQLDKISIVLQEAHELALKALNSSRWNMYKNLQLARKMDKVEKKISRFVQGPLQAHVLADLHHVRFETTERFDRLDGSAHRLEQRLGLLKIDEEMDQMVEKVDFDDGMCENELVKVGIELGIRKVKDMIFEDQVFDEMSQWVFGVNGIGGSGKTTLVREICRDDEVRSYFNNRILFLTVSQSPNMEELRRKIRGFLADSELNGCSDITPQWTGYSNLKTETPVLVVLDDVWSLQVLQQLIFKVPGCKTLVVSRIKFPPSVLNSSYELELLGEDDAVSLFCHTAFGRPSIPPGTDENLIKQIVEKCKGLPLALKVIGASLRDQPEKYWSGANKRLSRAQPINDSHEAELLNRMRLSIDYLSEKVRNCFLDLGSFPEDKKIPLDVLINVWTELHDIDEEEGYAILDELSSKNLLTLVKDSRAGDRYSSYYEISVCQHDVLRDLAIHMSSFESVNHRKRLVMARRENGVPKEWERDVDEPFLARIVSVHTGEMREMDWPKMEFPKAEVLILNFDSTEYLLPQFIENMPKLRALVLINYSTKTAEIHNLSVLGNLTSLRSLWFEKVSIPQLPKKTILPLTNLRKLSLLLCKINLKDEESELDLSHLFPRLNELAMDHCIEMTKLPSSLCRVKTLKSLSITNCESLEELPCDFGKLLFLQILRVYACPKLKTLPVGVKNLIWLEHIDVSQCVNLHCLNEEIGGCFNLKEIVMRECPQIKNLPKSVSGLRSLRRVICDEEVSWHWKEMEKELPGLCVQVVEQCFDLDWLIE